jgi:hypothetical protein
MDEIVVLDFEIGMLREFHAQVKVAGSSWPTRLRRVPIRKRWPSVTPGGIFTW